MFRYYSRFDSGDDTKKDGGIDPEYKEHKRDDKYSKYGEAAEVVDPETGETKKGIKVVSFLPARTQIGPYGLGEPEDKAILHAENDTIIKKRMYTAARLSVCKPEADDFGNCFRAVGDFWVLWSCRKMLKSMNNCIIAAMQDPEFHQRVTDDFLEERSRVRATGLTNREQRLASYREWKQQQETDDTASSSQQ